MRAGSLRDRVRIEERTSVQDAFGQPTETWQSFASVWASVEPLSGREFFSAQQVNAELTARVRTRYVEGVNSTMRIVHEGKVYNVKTVIDTGSRHSELELLCAEGVGDGG